MVVIKFPFTSMQQFNLDWIMQQLHKMLQFMPMNGVAGDVLQRNVDGAVWMPLTAVSLDIHSMSTIPEVEGSDELAIYDNSLQGNYKVTVQDLLDAATPPVTSVNGQTGAVVLDAGDVSALPDTTVIPSDTSDLTNNAGFVDAAGAAAAAPVQSVNGQTGAVTIPTINNVGATEISSPTATPSGSSITIHNNRLFVEISSDKKRIRVSGFLTFKSDSTSDWKYITITDGSDNPLDIVVPASSTTLHNAGLFFDENKEPAYIGNAVRIIVNTSGQVFLVVYQGTNTANLDQTAWLFGNWIQLAI